MHNIIISITALPFSHQKKTSEPDLVPVTEPPAKRLNMGVRVLGAEGLEDDAVEIEV